MEKNIFISWLIYAASIILTAFILPGVRLSGILAAAVTAIVLGLVNTFLKPILVVFTLPINILTLGLFTFIINALLVLLVAAIVPGFKVDNFWWALLFGVILSFVVALLENILAK